MLFDFPSKLTQGDTYTNTYILPEYLPSDGWSLKAHIQGATVLTLTSTVLNDEYVITLNNTNSQSLNAGAYQIVWYVEKSGERKTLSKQSLTIEPDFLNDTTDNFLTFNQKMVNALEALLLRRATNFQLDMLESTIDTKIWKKMSPIELQDLLDKYRHKVQQEVAAASGKSSFGKRIAYDFRNNY